MQPLNQILLPISQLRYWPKLFVSPKSVYIKSIMEKGRGVFAKRDIQKGETVIIGKFTGFVFKRTNYSFQIDVHTHVELDEPARIANHSCDPNTGVRSNEFGGYDFIALRDIRKDEEITWDYETTEYESIAVRLCLCGSSLCRGKTRGYKYLSEDVKKKYGIFIADYLKQS